MTYDYSIDVQFDCPMVSIKNENIFSELQFKMMSGGQMNGLLDCRVMMLDGQVTLVYLPHELHSLNSIIVNLNPLGCAHVIRQILSIIENIRSNGYMHIENIMLDLNFVYMDDTGRKIYIAYLPIENVDNDRDAVYTRMIGLANELVSGTCLTGHPAWDMLRNQLLETDISFDEFAGKLNEAFEEMSVSFCHGNNIAETSHAREFDEMMPKIILESVGVDPQIRFEMDKKEIKLGRDNAFSDVDLRRYGQISGEHCVLKFHDGILGVSDLNSRNGTFVDGKRLDAGVEYRLKDGCTVSLSTVTFLVHM